MITLYIDSITNKIKGFHLGIQEQTLSEDNLVFIDDCNLHKLNNHFFKPSTTELYYIGGKIVEKEEIPDEKEEHLNTINWKLSNATTKLKNEYRIFMDNIISGVSMEEAVRILESNRQNYEQLQKEKAEIETTIQKNRESKIRKKFEQEESLINYQYFLSMVTIVRDENDYLEEWIRYHIEEMGFEHFYIYDNESAIPVRDYLEKNNFKYLDRLTIIDWPTSKASQQDSHNHFLNEYAKKETKWFIGMDPDEYIFIKKKSKTLKEFLNENSDYATIVCLWKHFNANGKKEKTNEPDMIRFTTATDWDDYKHLGKRFSQSNRIKNFNSYVPQVRLNAPELTYETGMNRDFFQLNHYYTRSYDEFVAKIKRGSSNPNFRRKLSDFFELNPDMKYLDAGEVYEQGYGPAR